VVLVEGPTPVSEAIEFLEALLTELANDPLGQMMVSVPLANLLAMAGRADDARDLNARFRAQAQEYVYLRMQFELFGSGRVEFRTGDLLAAEKTTRATADRAAAVEDHWAYVIAAIDRARVVCDLGRPEECLDILEETLQHPAPPDFEIFVKRETTRALALARLGELEKAQRVAREAVEYASPTQFLGYHAEALVALAQVLRRQSRISEAVAALNEAVSLYERKGDVAAAARTVTIEE